MSNAALIREIEAEGTIDALNAALAANGVEADRVIAVHHVPSVHVTLGNPVPARYRVLYRG